MLMYFSNETQQDWRPGKREPDEAGGAFWLPGNVLLELHMVPPTSRGQDGDAQARASHEHRQYTDKSPALIPLTALQKIEGCKI